MRIWKLSSKINSKGSVLKPISFYFYKKEVRTIKYVILLKKTEGHFSRADVIRKNLVAARFVEDEEDFGKRLKKDINKGVSLKLADDCELVFIADKNQEHDLKLDLRLSSSGQHIVRSKIITKYGEYLTKLHGVEGFLSLETYGQAHSDAWRKESIERDIENGTLEPKYFYRRKMRNTYITGLDVLRGYNDPKTTSPYNICLPTEKAMDEYLHGVIKKRLEKVYTERLSLHPVQVPLEQEIRDVTRMVLEHQLASLKVNTLKVSWEDLRKKREENEDTES